MVAYPGNKVIVMDLFKNSTRTCYNCLTNRATERSCLRIISDIKSLLCYALALSLSEKSMAPHSSTLAWKIQWTEEPGRLQSMGSLGVGHDWVTSLSLSCIGEGTGNPLQCSCLENPRDGGAWWAAIYGVAKSRTWLKWLSSSSSSSEPLDKLFDFSGPNTSSITWSCYLSAGLLKGSKVSWVSSLRGIIRWKITSLESFFSVYFFLPVLGLHCCAGFSLAAVHELLVAVASLVVEHRFEGTRPAGVMAHRL